jgi:predicted helicase
VFRRGAQQRLEARRSTPSAAGMAEMIDDDIDWQSAEPGLVSG